MNLAVTRLRQLIQLHGTQVQAASALGISPQYLSDILRGRRSFSGPLLKKLGLKKVQPPTEFAIDPEASY